MALTNKEKKAFLLPVLISLLLIGLGVYNGYTSTRNREIQELLEKTTSQIRTNQEKFQVLKELEGKENFYFPYRLDDWIPLFQNSLEVRLYLTQKIKSGLDSVGAKERELAWGTLETTTSPFQSQLVLEALFPSYAAFMKFLEEMEKNKPPLLPKRVEIKKAGIKLEVSLNISFAFRLKDEAI